MSDPVLDSIQRWSLGEIGTLNGSQYKMHPFNDGGYVLYVDAVKWRDAAVAAAEQRAGEQAHGHYMDGYKVGYAKGLIEGDSGGRKEGYRAGYAAGKDAVMTSSYEQAVTQGEMEALGKWIDGVAKGRDDVGYHSQRCLHCDHIRATHTLTASGCLGHDLPGRPGADCPCSEFEEAG